MILQAEQRKDLIYQNQIAEALNVGQDIISRHINKLATQGYVHITKISNFNQLSLTDEAYKLLAVSRLVNGQPTSLPQQPQELRGHSFALLFTLLTDMSKQESIVIRSKGLKFNQSGLNNQTGGYSTYKEHTFFLAGDTLVIYTKEFSVSISEQPYLAYKPYIDGAFEMAEELEQLLGIKIKRLDKGVMSAKIMLNHNALTNNEVAKNLLENKEKLDVFDKEGNKRLIVDFSKNKAELETVYSKLSLPDMDRVRRHYLAELYGTFDYEQINNALLKLVEHQAKTDEQLGFYAEQRVAHVGTELKTQETLGLINNSILLLEREIRRINEQKQRKGLYTKVKDWIGKFRKQ
ncbi:MAG: hypothetical protein KGI27_13415 [Thaumarchaeota archaeon]|nr:hypothetical protein [Nitrososphaerota archaeon]